jgi:hypothetical protein
MNVSPVPMTTTLPITLDAREIRRLTFRNPRKRFQVKAVASPVVVVRDEIVEGEEMPVEDVVP